MRNEPNDWHGQNCLTFLKWGVSDIMPSWSQSSVSLFPMIEALLPSLFIIVNVDIIIIMKSMKNWLFVLFYFPRPNFCFVRTRLVLASTIGTTGIVTSWQGEGHSLTNKNIWYLCNHHKQPGGHKYTNVNTITETNSNQDYDKYEAQSNLKITSAANFDFMNTFSRFICERPGASMVEAWSNLNWYFTISRILLDFLKSIIKPTYTNAVYTYICFHCFVMWQKS